MTMKHTPGYEVTGYEVTRDGGPAFPHESYDAEMDMDTVKPGLSKLEYFAAAALSNPSLCTGEAPQYTLRAWFGERGGITREEIAARQASEFARAALSEAK